MLEKPLIDNPSPSASPEAADAPRRAPESALRQALAAQGYRGRLSGDPSERLVYSTDNSIYQVVPSLVARPEDGDDVARLVRANQTLARPLSMAARGGGTGTNGQSLTEGLLIDLSRQNRILEIDLEQRRARVEPGVVLDQLNAALEPHGLFFAPNVSTSSRATIGGMVATDAAGKGSRLYGRTSRHVRSLKAVLASGETWTFAPVPVAEAEAVAERGDAIGQLYQNLLNLLHRSRECIAASWPHLERGFTGYNVHDALQRGIFDPTRLLCGSEGTLALVTEIEVALEWRPQHRALCVVAYADFLTALREVAPLLAHDPAAVEVMDEHTQQLGRRSSVWSDLVDHLPADQGSCLYVEMVDDEASRLHDRLETLASWLGQHEPVRAFNIIRDAVLQKHMWRLRKDAVGLLARSPGPARPHAFVEDCAVPASRLADFIAEFRQLLDRHGFSYGMYGHADAGCVHVRPEFDLTAPDGRRRLRAVSDEAADLVERFGGVLWGEHGRGYRGEYARARLGEDLYTVMTRVKALFDPHGLMNRGKLYGPGTDDRVEPLDAPSLRADRNVRVTPELTTAFEPAFRCNGNAICHHHADRELMCPSFKATGDYRQSPKGRADLMREWTRQRSIGEEDEALTAGLLESMNGCLSCKACTSHCPALVDIPELKSRFFELHYRERRRPWRDVFMRQLEVLGPRAARLGGLINLLSQNPPVRWLARRLGVVDMPRFSSPSFVQGLAARGDRPRRARDLQGDDPARTVVLVPDAFTWLFDAPTLLAAYDLIAALGFRPRVLRLLPSGKFEHVKGYRREFESAARRQLVEVADAARLGLPLVGLEPSVTLLYRQEYAHLDAAAPVVRLFQEWMSEAEWTVAPPAPSEPHRLFIHCSEAAALPHAGESWQRVFSRLGLKLEPVSAGCCGMAGVFGHELENQTVSDRLFDLTWRPVLEASGARPARILATGFSCRSQLKRQRSSHENNRGAVHPVVILRDLLRDKGSVHA